MTTSKIFKKENGDKYEIKVTLYTDSSSNRLCWGISAYHCPAGKRKYTRLNCQDDCKYRKLDINEKRAYYKQFLLSHIPVKWIAEIQQEILKELSKSILI